MKIVRDSAFRMGVGSSFHQPGMVNENILECDFVSRCDGTMRQRSLADLRIFEGVQADKERCDMSPFWVR